jgi:hypothetical protein
MKTKILILSHSLFLISMLVFGQGVDIKSSAFVRVSGSAFLLIKDGGLINNGTYSKGTETVIFSGTAAKTISGSSNTILNDLTISNTGGITSQIGLLTANNLTITSGSKFTVDPGKALTATGTTSLNSAQCLLLKSDVSGTASFIDNGTINCLGGGTAKVERYLTPYGIVADLKFHFLSSPVNAQSVESEFIDLASTEITDFYLWDEPNNYWTSYRKGDYGSSDYFIKNPDFITSTFTAGKGYMVAYPETVTKNFIGTPYTNASGITINCTKTPGKTGWNLIGNPFPSSVDWTSAGITRTNVDAALYYYDNATPGYKYYVNLTGGLGSATKYIAPMQGVMVHASAASGSVFMTNNARTHTGQDVFYKDEPVTTNILDLKVTGNGYEDYTRVCFYEQAVPEFDGEFDAYKLFSYDANVPQLYSLTPNQTKLAINTQPALVAATSVPLGMQVGQTGSYALTFEGVNTFANASISLEDLKDNKLIDLGSVDSYSFNASAGEEPNRFVLHFGSVGIDGPDKTVQDIYSHGHNLYIRNTGNAILEIYNVAGLKIMHEQIHNSALYSTKLSVPTGYYIVRLTNAGHVKNAKIFIQ